MNNHSFMTATVATEKKQSDKREKIIHAAISVFSKRGFYNSTVADVAREAQVADGTIYLYFKNKDDLLISIFEYCMDFFIQAVTREIDKSSDPVERLKSFVHLHLKLVQKYQDLAQVIQIELRQSSKFMKEYANENFFKYLGFLEDILIQGQKDGVFRKDADPQILKRAIFGAIDEMALEWILMNKKRYSMESAADQLATMFINGLILK